MKFFLFAYWHDPRWHHFVGASVKIWDLAVNLNQMGHHVVMFLPKYGFRHLNAGFEIVEIPVINLPFLRAFSFNLFLMYYLISGWFKHRPDVVYLRRTMSIVPMIYARLKRALFFYEVNDDPYERQIYRAKVSFAIRSKLSVWVDEWNLKLSDRSFVISQELIAKILKMNPGLDPLKFILMPSGANLDVFFPMPREEALREVRLADSKNYVGFVGTLLAHQGLDILIEAAAIILKKNVNCRFLIIGEGPMKASWMDMARQRGLGDAFIFTGQIPYHDLVSWINVMDVCVAPYLSDAGYRSPVKIFDYLACARPVVASRIEGTTDIFRGLESVCLVEPQCPEKLADAVVCLLKDPIYRENIGKIGREWVKKNYDRKVMAKRISSSAADLLFFRPGHGKE